jgi:exopolyphosphatase/guanosine-5'-triphosphate,3'-diphosphate pyrophosphatase
MSRTRARFAKVFDLLRRHQHEDVRERPSASLMERYHVDPNGQRVENKAHGAGKVAADWQLQDGQHRELLGGRPRCMK